METRTPTAAPKPASGETILLVDDEDEVRHLVEGLLQRYGYRVLSAANGIEALETWQKNQSSVDLLLTDIVMPEGLTGSQLAAKLRADRPDLKVIYTSGFSVDLVVEAGEELVEGVNFIQKPYRTQTLKDTLRHALACG